MRELLEYGMIGLIVLGVIVIYNHIRARRRHLKRLERKNRQLGIKLTKGIR